MLGCIQVFSYVLENPGKTRISWLIILFVEIFILKCNQGWYSLECHIYIYFLIFYCSKSISQIIMLLFRFLVVFLFILSRLILVSMWLESGISVKIYEIFCFFSIWKMILLCHSTKCISPSRFRMYFEFYWIIFWSNRRINMNSSRKYAIFFSVMQIYGSFFMQKTIFEMLWWYDDLIFLKCIYWISRQANIFERKGKY